MVSPDHQSRRFLHTRLLRGSLYIHMGTSTSDQSCGSQSWTIRSVLYPKSRRSINKSHPREQIYDGHNKIKTRLIQELFPNSNTYFLEGATLNHIAYIEIY